MTTNDFEAQIKTLKEQLAKTKKQKGILHDAVEFASDAAGGIMLSLKANEIIKACRQAEFLQQTALKAMMDSLL